MDKLPITRYYEIYGNRHASRAEAFDCLLRDIKAANDLGIPFTVRTVKSKGYRNGGNVNKADVLTYEIVLGEITQRD